MFNELSKFRFEGENALYPHCNPEEDLLPQKPSKNAYRELARDKAFLTPGKWYTTFARVVYNFFRVE